jgi:rhodanese-related sulfurtransferase
MCAGHPRALRVRLTVQGSTNMKFFTENAFLFAMAFISGAMLLYPMLKRRAGGAGVDPTRATQMMNREHAHLIDVRSAEDFAKGHVAQAKNIPLDQLSNRAGDVGNKDKPVIVMCATGQTSAKAASALRSAGFSNVVTLVGGLGAWQSAGLPTVKG